MASRDRRTAVLQSTALNGIDFVEIANQQQTTLHVHFLNAVEFDRHADGDSRRSRGGETIPTVAVLPIADTDWGFDDGHVVLTLRVAAPGDFSTYTLTISEPGTRPASSIMSPSRSRPAALPTSTASRRRRRVRRPQATRRPSNYLAKDFLSFRQALLDFSALRYPQWQERSEADFGVMFLEALSALADDLSYTQDRIAAEATLATATQRRSVVRHARLVDYEPTPAVSASVMLHFDVAPGVATIPDGVAVIAPGPSGDADRVRDRQRPAHAPARIRAERRAGKRAVELQVGIAPYWFDDSERCLKAGATEMYVLGRGFGFQPGQLLLIETAAASTADPPMRQIVQLLDAGDAGGSWASEECDDLFLTPGRGGRPAVAYLPRVAAGRDGADGRHAHSLACAGPTHGRSRPHPHGACRQHRAGHAGPHRAGAFVVGPPAPGDAEPGTIVRTGARAVTAPGVAGSPAAMHLYTLANAPVAWLPQPTLDPSGAPLPEILLQQQNPAADPTPWSWFRRLLDAGEFDLAFTLDAARYTQIARNSDNSVQYRLRRRRGRHDPLRRRDLRHRPGRRHALRRDLPHRRGRGRQRGRRCHQPA